MNSLNSLAQYLRYYGEYDRAIPLYKRALAIIKKFTPNNRLSIATILHGLGATYYSLKDYDQAEPILEEALAIREEEGGPSYFTIHYLAHLNYRKGNLSQAENLYKKSLELREDKFGPQHAYIIPSLNGLAKVYGKQGKYEKAKALYERALIISKRFDPEHPQLASTLAGLAKINKAQKEYTEAEKLYLRSLQIFENKLSNHHPVIIKIYQDLIDLYELTDQNDKATFYKSRLNKLETN